MSNKRLLEMANSNLGIWFLSTVVAGAISFGYATLTHSYQVKQQHDEIMRKLKIEIIQRMLQAQAYEEEIEKGGEEMKEVTRSILSAPFETRQSNFRIYSAFPEFENRPVVSVLVEMRTRATDDERKMLDESLPHLYKLMPQSVTSNSMDELDRLLKGPFWNVE